MLQNADCFYVLFPRYMCFANWQGSVMGTHIVMEAAKHSSLVRRFIYISSDEIYGNNAGGDNARRTSSAMTKHSILPFSTFSPLSLPFAFFHPFPLKSILPQVASPVYEY